MAASSASSPGRVPPAPRRRRQRSWALISGSLLAVQIATLAGCGATDGRSGSSASSIQSSPSAQDAVNGTASGAMPPSPATPDPVDPSHNPATPNPQSTGPTAPAP